MQISNYVLGVYFFYLPTLNFYPLSELNRIQLLGDHRRGVPPVPIPNTAVKPSAANGSRTLGPARVGRCQVYSPVIPQDNRASYFFIRNASDVTLNLSSD